MKFSSKFFLFASAILVAISYFLGYESRIFGSQFFLIGLQHDKKLDLLVLFTVISVATLIAHAIKNKSYNFILIPLVILMASAGGIGGFKNSTPRIYNVELFGASGNANDVTDAGMTGTTTLTSSTANFTSADVGKSCIMYGSGAAGVNQVGTITGFTNSTTITVSFTAAGTVTNKEFFYGTESAAGIQNAYLAADAALGGKVWYPNGVYFLGGSLITSQNGSNPNCQIYIPFHVFSGQFEYSIESEGESAVNIASGYLGTPNPTVTTGVVLRSIITGTGTNPAVIAGGDGSHQVATSVWFSKICIQVYTNQGTVAPTMSALWLHNIYKASAYRVNAVLDVPNQNSSNPSGTESAGIGIGFISEAGPNTITECNVGGFKYGYVLGEHTIVDNNYALSCQYGYVILSSYFTVTGFTLYHACNNGVYFPNGTVMGVPPGPSRVFDLKFEAEIDSSAFFGGHWYNTFVSNISDPGNNCTGIIKTLSVLGNTSVGNPPAGITVVGGSNITSLAWNVAAPATATPTLSQVLAAGNTSTSAQTLIMTGASGTSSIQVTGSSTSAPQAFFGGIQLQSISADNQVWGSNIKFNGSNFAYVTSTTGAAVNVAGGGFTFFGYPSGTAGNAATQTYTHNMFANGNIELNSGGIADNGTGILQVVSSSLAQLALHYNAANKTQFTTSSTGNLTVAPSGGASTITGSLNVSGAQFNGVTLVSATGTYNVLSTDYQVVFTGSTATVVYPTATTGRSLWIANQASGTVTIPTTTTSNGTTSTSLTTGQWMYVFFDGSIWRGKIMN